MTFSASINFMEIYIKTCPMAPTKGEASCLAQIKPLWLKIRTCTTASIPLEISSSALRQNAEIFERKIITHRWSDPGGRQAARRTKEPNHLYSPMQTIRRDAAICIADKPCHGGVAVRMPRQIRPQGTWTSTRRPWSMCAHTLSPVSFFSPWPPAKVPP
jgi:hypothetical protein